MQEYPVKVGSMLFTMVDPNVGHEVAYNRWYERDHFYGGCMVGPWILAGSRWVSPRTLKDKRFPTTSPFAEPVDAGSYVAIYFIHAGHVKEHFDWAGKQVVELYKDGRGFAERSHAHTCLYDFADAVYAPDETVSIELALDHRFKGMFTIVTEPSDDTSDEAHLAEVQSTLASQLFTDPAVRIVSSWRLRGDGVKGEGAPMKLGTDGGNDRRLVNLVFVNSPDGSAWDVARAAADALDESGVAKVTFASPWYPTNIGTDDFTDQLW